MRYSSTRHISLFFCFCIALIISTTARAQSVIYVNHTATGADDGTSWTNAYTFLQDALQAAQSGDEVWVAQGVYRPDQGAGVVPGDREASFLIPSGVSLFGGFAGIETARAQRDWQGNLTVLSGDLHGNDTATVSRDEPSRSDNSVHVVGVFSNGEQSILDGFTITAGHAHIPFGQWGGGISVGGPVELRNLIISNNTASEGAGINLVALQGINSVLEHIRFENNEAQKRGGGLHVNAFYADYRHLEFINNRAIEGPGGGLHNARFLALYDAVFVANEAEWGGGINNPEASVLYLANSTFVGNHAISGGAIQVDQSAMKTIIVIINSVFSGNSATIDGGAITSLTAPIDLINSTLAHNSAGVKGGGIYHATNFSSVRVRNSILWGNTANGVQDQFRVEFFPSSPGGSTVSTIETSLLAGALPAGTTDDGLTINEDPLFIDIDGDDDIFGTLDDNYRLAELSPAIDSGTNSFLPPDTLDFDLDGNVAELLPADLDMHVRVFDGGSGMSTVDIGAYEYGAPPVVLANDRSSDVHREASTLISNYPNPFSVSTTISYSVSTTSEVTLEIYNILGKRVRVLEQGFVAAGEHSVQLDAAGLSTGVYLLRLIAGSNSQTRKMVVVR